MGDFNGWNRDSQQLRPLGSSGIWQGFLPGLGEGEVYKYYIASRYLGYRVEKADPFAFGSEVPPKTASMVRGLDHAWTDQAWMEQRQTKNSLAAPISVYEVHLGSWMRVPEEGGRSLSYREMAPKLAGHVKKLGYTHVELMPVMEHPFYGSWGYQITGYFAPSARYGTPQDLMYLIDVLHHYGIGVILDWVPAHFPTDQHGLGFFDGTHLYEHADPRKGFHPDWDSFIFNYGRNEVRSFLTSNAMFWLDKYHVDGLRVDAVASMLYLDYSRKEGEWIPNEFGGRENLPAISLLQRLNQVVYQTFPDVQMIAEESTAWPMVSRPTYVGGLGFGLKWDMGWMHDTLAYMARDPLYRRHHQNEISFSIWYAFSENFVLPLSHDEVVYGKRSLLSKMPGDDWQRFANLRMFLAWMYGHPGKKLLFMGGEFGQRNEWNHDTSLDWLLLSLPRHDGVRRLVQHLNYVYKSEPALWQLDDSYEGFDWIDFHDADNSVVSFLRKSREGDVVAFVVNATPVVRYNYRLGVPESGFYRELINTDAETYGGSNVGNLGGVQSEDVPWMGREHSILVHLPPLATLAFKLER